MKYCSRILYSALFLFLSCYCLTAQINLVTFAQTSAGGYDEANYHLDFSMGQQISFPIEETEINGGIGVLQLISSFSTSVISPELAGISVYPNPMQDRLNIETDCYQNLKMVLFQNEGKVVLEVDDIDCFQSVPVSHLSAGYYTLRIFNNDLVNNYKLIKF